MWEHMRRAKTVSCLLILLAHTVIADVKQLSAAVLGEQPIWMQNRSADIILDFSKADPNFRHPSFGRVAVRGKERKVDFHIGYYHGNVAIVRYGTEFRMAVRKMHFYKTLRSSLENYPLSNKKGKRCLLQYSTGITWRRTNTCCYCSICIATIRKQQLEKPLPSHVRISAPPACKAKRLVHSSSSKCKVTCRQQ